MRTVFATAALLAAPFAQAHTMAGLPPDHLHGWDLLALAAVLAAGAAWLVARWRG